MQQKSTDSKEDGDMKTQGKEDQKQNSLPICQKKRMDVLTQNGSILTQLLWMSLKMSMAGKSVVRDEEH